jgi:hypothetical protein
MILADSDLEEMTLLEFPLAIAEGLHGSWVTEP